MRQLAGQTFASLSGSATMRLKKPRSAFVGAHRAAGVEHSLARPWPMMRGGIAHTRPCRSRRDQRA